MTPIAIFFLVFALCIVWGGLIGSIVLLSRKPELDVYPAGDQNDSHRTSDEM